MVAYNVLWNQWYDERQNERHNRNNTTLFAKNFHFCLHQTLMQLPYLNIKHKEEVESWNRFLPRDDMNSKVTFKKNNNKMIMCLFNTFSLFMLCQKFKKLEKPQTLLKKPTFFKILIYQVSIKEPWPFVGVRVKVGLNMKIFISINQKME